MAIVYLSPERLLHVKMYNQYPEPVCERWRTKMRPCKQIVGHRMKPIVFWERRKWQRSVRALFWRSLTVEHSLEKKQRNLTAGACGAERGKGRERKRDGNTWGGGRGGGFCQSASIFTRRSHWLSHGSPLHYPSIPHTKSPFVSKATTSQVSLTTSPSSPKTTHNCDSPMPLPLIAGAAMIMVAQQHRESVRREWWRGGNGKAKETGEMMKGEVNDMDREGKWKNLKIEDRGGGKWQGLRRKRSRCREEMKGVETKSGEEIRSSREK